MLSDQHEINVTIPQLNNKLVGTLTKGLNRVTAESGVAGKTTRDLSCTKDYKYKVFYLLDPNTKYSSKRLFILTPAHSMQIFREIPFVKPQNDT